MLNRNEIKALRDLVYKHGTPYQVYSIRMLLAGVEGEPEKVKARVIFTCVVVGAYTLLVMAAAAFVSWDILNFFPWNWTLGGRALLLLTSTCVAIAATHREVPGWSQRLALKFERKQKEKPSLEALLEESESLEKRINRILNKEIRDGTKTSDSRAVGGASRGSEAEKGS